MSASPKTSTCARCASRLEERYRFCPECGLPAGGTGVLSTQIHEVRPKEQPARRARDWTRLLLPSGATLMLVFVVGMGLVLYNRELLDRVFPQPEEPEDDRPSVTAGWEPDWVAIPAGISPIGPPTQNPDDQPTWNNRHGFLMSRYEVTNAQWKEFLTLAGEDLRARGLWEDADPGSDGGWNLEADDVLAALPHGKERYPVRNVSLTMAIEYCRWLTQRLGDPEWEIRLPRNVEWEYAARGHEGRRYSWGNDFDLPAAPKLRLDPRPPPGIDEPQPRPVDGVTSDTSPFGVVGMGTNVAEWAISDVEWDDLEVLAPKQGFKRGASFAVPDDAKGARMAQTWNLPRVEARLPQADLGFRLVKVRKATDDN